MVICRVEFIAGHNALADLAIPVADSAASALARVRVRVFVCKRARAHGRLDDTLRACVQLRG